MVKKTKIAVIFTLILFASIFLTANVSAGSSWKRIAIFENLLDRSSSYDIIWEGPYQGGTLFVNLRSDQPSILTTLGGDLSSVDRLTYERRDNTRYSSRNTGSSFRSWRSSTFGDRSYSRNSYERLTIDNSRTNQILAQNIFYPRYNDNYRTYSWRY